MIKFILSLTIIFLSKTIFTQSPCLESIKEGKFTHFASDGRKTLIIRKKNRQIELFGKKKAKLSVKWIKEDEYFLEEKDQSAKSDMWATIHVKITGCYEDYYNITAFFLDKDGVVMEEVSARYYRGKR